MFRHIIPIILILAVAVAACTDAQKEETEAAVEYETQEFIAQARITLDEVDQGVSELESDLMEAEEETRTGIQEALVALRTQRDKLRQDLQRVEEAGGAMAQRQESVLEDRLDRLQSELEAAQLSAIEEREEFEQAVDARLTETDEMLGDLQEWTQQAAADVDSSYAVTITEIESQREELAVKIEEMSQASDEAFLEMRQSIAASVAELNRELNDVMNHVEQKFDADDLAEQPERM